MDRPHKHENQPKPLTKQEIHDATVARVSAIDKEFNDGFNFMKHYPRSVSIFGGVRIAESDPYYAMARSLGSRIVNELNYSVFTGGGPGIMEAANRGAFEAGGQSLGLTIELPFEQQSNQYLTKFLDFYYFFSRKVCLHFSGEAYVFFPGGFGTFDEFFEILTLVQTGKIEKVPIILFGSEYWNKVDNLIKEILLSRNAIDPTDVHLYKITDNEDEVIEIIRNAPVRNGLKFEHDAIYGHHRVEDAKE
ncbi:MAG: TIGR00730 family Rossman fold protein [Patescibacteria group bacterium]